MNTNVNTVNTDANNEAAKALANMFTGTTIAKTSASGGTITLTLTDGDTITIRHETRTRDFLGETRTKKTGTGGGITLRARDAIDNSQKITAAWVEKTEMHQEPTYYGDDYGKTTETISLWVMFEGDLRPTRLTSNQTTYTWDSYSPDFTLKHGDTTIAASDAYLYPDDDSSWYRY